MKKGEIWIVDLGTRSGREQMGERPAVVIGHANQLVQVIPLTSNLERYNMSFTLLIEKTPKNGLSKDSIALVFQIVSIDKRRLKRRVGILSEDIINALEKLVLDLLKIGK